MPLSRKRTAALVAAGGLALAMVLAAVVWLRGAVSRAKRRLPGGPCEFSSGRSRREEIFTSEAGDHRELMVTVHYPVDAAFRGSRAAYVDAGAGRELAKAYSVWPLLFGRMKSHALAAAPCAMREGGFPVVVFSPGFNASPLFYTELLEELASHGFVVVSVSHPYSTRATVFPEGRVVAANDAGTRFEVDKRDPQVDRSAIHRHRDEIGEVWVGDVRFVLDWLARLGSEDERFETRLDLQRVGIFGHSFGGATAAEAVQLDERFKAGINLDGTDFSTVRRDGVQGQFLWLLSTPPLPPAGKAPPGKMQHIERGGPGEKPNEQRKLPRVVFQQSGENKGTRVRIDGFAHQTFESDAELLGATWPWSMLAGRSGPRDGRRAVTLVNAFVVDFFRQQLSGEDAAWLDAPEKRFPEAKIEAAKSLKIIHRAPSDEPPPEPTP